MHDPISSVDMRMICSLTQHCLVASIRTIRFDERRLLNSFGAAPPIAHLRAGINSRPRTLPLDEVIVLACDKYARNDVRFVIEKYRRARIAVKGVELAAKLRRAALLQG